MSELSEVKPVRSWKGIGLLAVGGLLVHALYSEWLISAETVRLLMPEFADTFEAGSALYQRAFGQLIDSLARLFGLGL